MAIHVYYRHASMRVLTAKSRPEWFSYSKCFNNFLETVDLNLERGKVVLNVVYDGSQADFETSELSARFREIAEAGLAIKPELRIISGGDQRKAWRACVDLVRQDIVTGKVGANDYVYFLENDYMHVPGWVKKIDELVASGAEWDYLTLYDHSDKYPGLCASPDSARYSNLKSKIYCTGSHHWRTTPSTCATYIVPVRVFLADLRLLRLGIYDFKLFKLLSYLRRRTLVSPLPSLATHSMTEFLAPAVDWERL